MSRPAVTSNELAPEFARLRRRGVVKSALSLGSLALLTGCDLSTHTGVNAALWAMLRVNDRIQAALFSPTHLADIFPPDAITRPFRFNAFYEEWQVRTIDAAEWRLELAGAIADRTPWTLAQLAALPRATQITRHICIEGWSQIGQWSGIPLRDFLRRIGADLRAPYVAFRCFDGYSTSLDMASALHPQTILALDFDGAALEPQWGAPLRLRIPTKLGFKSAKNLQAIEVTDKYPGGYWEDQGYDWFSGA